VERSSISGPSFLGLNDPPPQKRSSLSIAPQSLDPQPTSRNLDYLLDDEEPPKSGAWKIILIGLVLALAGGLGYMRWKNQSFSWLSSATRKPAATTQPADAADSTAPDSSSGTAASPPAASPASTEATSSPANPVSSPAPEKIAPSTTTPAVTAPAAENAAPLASSRPPATPSVTKKKKAEPADPNLTPRVAANKSIPADATPSKPAKLQDSVTDAQRYIYGKGVPQDCDRGLRLLKPAADHANPKAMIEMGALYSAGLCTPRDLPTAYRWFALALRKDPENQSVQTDLQKLWSEMTQPERQLAIKLSQ
jgi:hypothetical protein